MQQCSELSLLRSAGGLPDQIAGIVGLHIKTNLTVNGEVGQKCDTTVELCDPGPASSQHLEHHRRRASAAGILHSFMHASFHQQCTTCRSRQVPISPLRRSAQLLTLTCCVQTLGECEDPATQNTTLCELVGEFFTTATFENASSTGHTADPATDLLPMFNNPDNNIQNWQNYLAANALVQVSTCVAACVLLPVFGNGLMQYSPATVLP